MSTLYLRVAIIVSFHGCRFETNTWKCRTSMFRLSVCVLIFHACVVIGWSVAASMFKCWCVPWALLWKCCKHLLVCSHLSSHRRWSLPAPSFVGRFQVDVGSPTKAGHCLCGVRPCLGSLEGGGEERRAEERRGDEMRCEERRAEEGREVMGGEGG